MTKTLVTLKKLANRKVEDLEQNLAAVRQGIGQVKAALVRNAEEMVRAGIQAAEGTDLMMMQAAQGFIQRLKMERAKLDGLLAQGQAREQEVLAALRVAFMERERYDILHQRREAERKKSLAKKAQDGLDEIGGRVGAAVEKT